VGAPSQPAAQQAGSNNWVRNSFFLLVVVILLIGLATFVLPRLRGGASTNTTTSSTTTTGGAQPITPATTGSSSPISVQVINGEAIGISDGTFAFDAHRDDANLKQLAAAALKQGNTISAQSLLNQAIATDSSDAEAQIYRENLRVGSSPHVTFVVGAMPSANDSSMVDVSRSTLQGAYVAQQEFNKKQPDGLKARLLIANSGGDTKNATQVANQIVQLAKSDSTFVGVMGWPYSGLTIAAQQVLAQAQIPMVSSGASTDDLTGSSPYFFRVVPSNKAQGVAGAEYAQQTLGAKNVAVFVDPADPYSQSLANDFSQSFKGQGGNVVVTENYTIGQAQTVQSALKDALTKNPDLIYFSGYAKDVSGLLSGLGSANAPITLNVLGGDALYELGGYGNTSATDRGRLRFTTFAFADEWGGQQPAFYSEYSAAFSGGKSGYGFTRPQNDAIISYDAMSALLNAAAVVGKTTMTPNDIKQALTTTAFQGASGYIKFGSDGDPVNKAIVVLKISPQGFTQMEKVVGSLTSH
jgi:ABC-type branched-subunit amino acid transport system substrate-binding protein